MVTPALPAVLDGMRQLHARIGQCTDMQVSYVCPFEAFRMLWRDLKNNYTHSAFACASALESLEILIEQADSARISATAYVEFAAEVIDRSLLQFASNVLASATVSLSLILAMRNHLTLLRAIFVAQTVNAALAPLQPTKAPLQPTGMLSPPFAFRSMRFAAASAHRCESSLGDRTRRGVPTQWSSNVNALPVADKILLCDYLGEGQDMRFTCDLLRMDFSDLMGWHLPRVRLTHPFRL